MAQNVYIVAWWNPVQNFIGEPASPKVFVDENLALRECAFIINERLNFYLRIYAKYGYIPEESKVVNEQLRSEIAKFKEFYVKEDYLNSCHYVFKSSVLRKLKTAKVIELTLVS